MKAGFVGAAALGLASLALAQPHQIRHVHPKRDQAVETVVDYQTVEQEKIVVYMDDDNRPVATSTFWSNMEPTAAPAAPATSAVAAQFHQVEVSSAAPAPSSPAPAPSSQAPAPSSGSGSGSGSDSGSAPSNSGPGFGRGISYSPYQSNGDCKTVDQIKQDLNTIGDGYQVIRLYGTDCNQVQNVLQASEGKNTQIMAGVFDVNSWQSEVQTIINAVKSNAGGNWDRINTVSIGNEVVNSGQSDVGTVTGAVNSARQMLKAAGFKGSVVNVDTMVAYKNNPGLCSAGDYCAINCHAFFDGHTVAADAGKFVQGWVQQISSMNNGKMVVVTESGWPKSGDTNGVAVPSKENQQAALSSLKSAMSNNLVLYTAFDDLWKKNNANTFNAEQAWGFL